MLRAGPFSDERLVGLINRRFVPFYFDVFGGFAQDTDAKDFVTKARPEMAGAGVATPPVLLMTPEGKVLAEISSYADTETFLRIFRQTLDDNGTYDKPSREEEQAASAVDRARILIDLLKYPEARTVLADETGSEACYLRGHLSRLTGDWESMGRSFSGVTDPVLADDVRMERAYRLWTARDFIGLKEALAGIPAGSNRYSEARYYAGLAEYHLGKQEEAVSAWRDAVLSLPEDGWVYRADWAYTECVEGSPKLTSEEMQRLSKSPTLPPAIREHFKSLVASGKTVGGRTAKPDKRVSLLKRIGYLGRKNPDLHLDGIGKSGRK